MCDFLLSSWTDFCCGVCVHFDRFWSMAEVAVDRCWYSPAIIHLLRIVGDSSGGDGAWRWLGGFYRLPSLRRFDSFGVVEVHFVVAGLLDKDGGIHGKLGRSFSYW